MKPYRKSVAEAILSMKETMEGMEYFGADARAPIDVMLEKLSYCSVYVGIIGMRYGSIDPATKKSYTQLEYERARELGIPCLIYIIDSENALIPPKFVDTGESATLLDAFKKSLRSDHTCQTFTTPDTLASALKHDLPEAIKQARAVKERTTEPEMNVPVLDPRAEFQKVERFLLRPVKYHGTEATVTLCLTEDVNGWRLKSDLQRAFGLKEGDTSTCEVLILPPDGYKSSVRDLSRLVDLYLAGDDAEWIIDQQIHKGDKIVATVTLLSARVANVTKEGGSERLVGLVFKKGIQLIKSS